MSDCYDLDVEVESLESTDLEALLEAPGGTVEIGIEAYVGLPGEPGPPGPGAPIVEAENKAGVTIYAGQAVTQHSSGTGYVLASRSAMLTAAVGIATTTAAPGTSLTVALAGPVTAEDWTAATGAATLSPRAEYLLGYAGALTVAPTIAAPDIIQFVGRAIAPDTLRIDISTPYQRR